MGKAFFKAGLQLWREVDLGHHDQHLRAGVGRQHACRGAQIDLGFAAASGAKQQRRPFISIKFGQGPGLLCAKCY